MNGDDVTVVTHTNYFVTDVGRPFRQEAKHLRSVSVHGEYRSLLVKSASTKLTTSDIFDFPDNLKVIANNSQIYTVWGKNYCTKLFL